MTAVRPRGPVAMPTGQRNPKHKSWLQPFDPDATQCPAWSHDRAQALLDRSPTDPDDAVTRRQVKKLISSKAMAHEFGHMLVDRGQARRVPHSSTPWAQEAVERRANAFAAMFLMPYGAVDAAPGRVGNVTDANDVAAVSRRMVCGRSAVLEHLTNIDRISPDVYFKIRSEIVEI